MKVRTPLIICALLALLMTVSYVHANSRTVDFAARRASGLEGKRVNKQMWSSTQTNSMMNKRFPIEQWDKHFSSVGSKRAPISVTEGKEKKRFETKTWQGKEVELEMSRWNDRVADLHRKAGIEMDDRAQLVADRQLYNMMLQDTRRFADMGDEVSLRDLNRYQFRSNRAEGAIPVEQAGTGR